MLKHVTPFLVGALLVVSPALGEKMQAIVQTSSGPVSGSDGGDVVSWKGIPFAKPPVGDLRWRAPQPVDPWETVLDATTYRSDCIQLPFGHPTTNMQVPVSEDCLYLNAWKPAIAKGKLPIIIWIYGGGWVIGGSSPKLYSGENLAREGLLVFNFNYRIGRFGFFAHPQLTRSKPDQDLFYNYGVLDQIAALKWIKQNAAAFGGDPNNITIMGESAGGVSIHILATSPQVPSDLFHKAIIMSGANAGDFGTGRLADAERVGAAFAEAEGVASEDLQAISKLRALPADRILGDLGFQKILQGPPGFIGAGPVEDGRIVVNIGKAYNSGRFKRVLMMIGATADDMGGRTGFMVAGARRASLSVSSQGVPVFQYRFSFASPTVASGLALHASDIAYFLRNPARIAENIGPVDTEIMMRASQYVVAFARTDPSKPRLPGWPRFVGKNGVIADFGKDGRLRIGPDPWADEIDAAPPPSYPGLGAAREVVRD